MLGRRVVKREKGDEWVLVMEMEGQVGLSFFFSDERERMTRGIGQMSYIITEEYTTQEAYMKHSRSIKNWFRER